MSDKKDSILLSKAKILEWYKRNAPYILPFIVVVALIALLLMPVKVAPPDVLKFVSYETGEPVCSKLNSMNIGNNYVKVEDYFIKKVGLASDENYPIYIRYIRTVYGDYYVHLIRCDPEYAYFPIKCTVYTAEGDYEVVTFTDARQMVILLYEGKAPNLLTATCEAVRTTK